MTQLKAAFETAKQAEVNKQLDRMLPLRAAMTEQELRAMLDQLNVVAAIEKCPYSGMAFGDQTNEPYVMLELDGTFKVGVEEHMKMRADRDDGPYLRMVDVGSCLKDLWLPMFEARVAKEHRLAEEARIRREAVNRIGRIAVMLEQINEVDGLHPEPASFDAMLEKVVRGQKIDEDELLLYFEDRNQRRAALEAVIEGTNSASELTEVAANDLPPTEVSQPTVVVTGIQQPAIIDIGEMNPAALREFGLSDEHVPAAMVAIAAQLGEDLENDSSEITGF